MWTRPAAERRMWWQVFGLLVLACSVWAVALPPMTGPDEAANAVRAAAVVRGQLSGDPMPEWMDGAPEWVNVLVEVEVPEWLADAGNVSACYTGEPRELFYGAVPKPRSSGCPELSGETREVTGITYEYRGQPSFYALVGLPSLLAAGDAGALGMRVVGLLLCSALLASALVSVRRLTARTQRLVMLGALVALSPEVLYLASTQNTGGLEIAASLCLWAAGLALVAGPDEPDRRLVHRVGAAATILVLTRGLSPVFALLTLVVLMLVARPGRVRALLGRTDVRAWLGGVTAATAVSAVWLWYIHAVFPLQGYPATGLAAAWDRVPWWGQGMVAVFGSTDVVPPFALHWAWVIAAGVVVGLGVLGGSRRHALLALGLVVTGVGLLISGEGFGVPQTGFWWQGRYVLPCIVGALLVAPAGVRRVPERLVRRAGWGLLGLFVAGQVWGFAYAMRHYTVGHDGPYRPDRFLFDPIWSPPLHPALLLVLFTGAVTGLALLLWRSVAGADDPGDPGDDDDGTEVAREDEAPVGYRRSSVMAGKAG